MGTVETEIFVEHRVLFKCHLFIILKNAQAKQMLGEC